jgi:tetratricopeptide (TPR) repeat protein
MAVPAAKAISARCGDPLIRYVHAVYVVAADKEKTPAEIEKALGAAADALSRSEYPSIRKAFASYRAAVAFFNVHGHPPKAPPRPVHLMRSSVNYLSEALFDKSMPPSEAYLSCNTIVEEFDGKTAARHDMFGSLVPTLEKAWKDHAWAHYIIGCIHIAKAWEARGSGLANTVDQAGWDGMRERLQSAELYFKKAFEMDPTDWHAPVKMIKVVMIDDGRRAETEKLSWSEIDKWRRSEMEKWFNRAMTLNTNCFEAVSSKSFFLEPRWHGDRDDALEFARECVASKKWGGRVPLILPHLHASLQAWYKIDRSTYYSDPQVWKDIDSTYKRFFELNPNAVGQRHSYARDAYRCGQYAVFLEQLPLFTTGTNYSYFGSKESFSAMVRLAQESTANR